MFHLGDRRCRIHFLFKKHAIYMSLAICARRITFNSWKPVLKKCKWSVMTYTRISMDFLEPMNGK